MSNLTEAGRAFIPDVIKVPFEYMKVTVNPDASITIDMMHGKDSVWSITRGGIRSSDCVVCGPFEASINVKVGF